MDSKQRERCDSMIIQPEWGTRNVNKYFYESEARRIAALNSTRCRRYLVLAAVAKWMCKHIRLARCSRIFEDVGLTAAEKRTLVWLAGWDEYTIENVLSAIRKTMAAEAARR